MAAVLEAERVPGAQHRASAHFGEQSVLVQYFNIPSDGVFRYIQFTGDPFIGELFLFLSSFRIKSKRFSFSMADRLFFE